MSALWVVELFGLPRIDVGRGYSVLVVLGVAFGAGFIPSCTRSRSVC